MRDLRLHVGDRHDLALRGVGSAGYSWAASVDGPSGVVEIGRRAGGRAPQAQPGGPPPDNISRPEVLVIQAVGAGSVVLHLALRREWEERPPLREDHLAIVVEP